MFLLLWLTDKKQLTPQEVVKMSKDAVIAIAEKCDSQYPEEIEKRKNKNINYKAMQ